MKASQIPLGITTNGQMKVFPAYTLHMIYININEYMYVNIFKLTVEVGNILSFIHRLVFVFGDFIPSLVKSFNGEMKEGSNYCPEGVETVQLCQVLRKTQTC